MPSAASLLYLAHLTGLALGMGAATAKTVLLLRSGADPGLISTFLSASKPLTRLIVTGLALLTASGIGWLLLAGLSMTPRLAVKLVLVAAIFVLGPLIDNVVEPAYRRLAPGPGEAASAGFLRARTRYVAFEVVATLLFYVITILWVLR